MYVETHDAYLGEQGSFIYIKSYKMVLGKG